MRIERVVADSFAKASEQTRKLYGSDCMVLSTSNVGDVTEILVAVDTPANDEPEPRVKRTAPHLAQQFENTLAIQLSQPTRKSEGFEKKPIVGNIRIDSSPASNDAQALNEGQVLVKAIREELRAMERRLAQSQSSQMPMSMVSLLEMGVSARYLDRWMSGQSDHEQLAGQLVQDLKYSTDTSWMHASTMVICGPTGAGKTTLTMQLAKTAGVENVIGLKDARLGARERFFALADRAGLDGIWGHTQPVSGFIDSGSMSPTNLEAQGIINAVQPALLCLPAHLSRAAAAEWLRIGAPTLGVVLTHWNPHELPIGLLTQLAEAGVPLKGICASAEVTEPLLQMNSSDLRTLIARKLDLVLYTDGVCG